MATVEKIHSSVDTAVAETPAAVAEFTGRHLEAYFIKGVGYHKERILRAFGGSNELPPLPRGDLAETVTVSEKRYQKASDLLYREEPLEIPDTEGEITQDQVVALADNLAWKGIEDSITQAHMDEIHKSLAQMAAGGWIDRGEVSGLKSRERALRTIVLEDNHFYRDFFDSELAVRLNLDSPLEMRNFFKKTSLTGNGEDSVTRKARGISLEIAANRYLSSLVSDQEAIVGYGNSEEDREGGDIVVIQGDKIVYIDLKSMRPGHGKGFSEDEIERGYRLYADNAKNIYKAIVWPETEEAVADDAFRLTDPSLQGALQKIVLATR